MNLEVANKLLKLRKENNLSQEELAERLGISRQAISKWERGEASPDTDNLIQLSNLYRISLDELLDIDVKTFKTPTYPHSSSDMNAQTIRLTKSENDELNYMFSETSSKRVVYPKDSLKEEIYPSGNKPSFQEPEKSVKYNDFNTISTPYRTQNPIATVPNDNSTKSQRNSKKNKKKKKSFVPPFTANKFINKFESLMAKFKISYKGLYTFPIYAIGIALAVFFEEVLYYRDAGYLSAMSILGIPLYYTFINSIEHRNPNRFGYPILALMMMLFSCFMTNNDELSALWLATIPFYYWFVNKNK